MRKLIAPAALVAGLVLSSGAFAAPAPNASSQAVAASEPAVRVQHTGRTAMMTGAPIDVVTASQPVRYAHLNLANPADANRLDQRIDAAAAQSCRELRGAYPPGLYPTLSGGNCVSSAEHRAESSVDPVVDAAANR